MNTVTSIERIESGPAWADRASEQFEGYDSAAAEAQMAADFQAAADRGDANAVCQWAPWVTDWDAIKRTPIDQRTTTCLPKRVQTLAEVMAESLDSRDGPQMTEVMQLVLNAANGCDADLAVQAGDLVERMGAAFALNNC